MSYLSDVAVQSISFRPDNVIEITYAEQRDITPAGTLVKCLIFEGGKFPGLTDELMDEVRELIDAVLGEMAGTPTSIPGKVRT